MGKKVLNSMQTEKDRIDRIMIDSLKELFYVDHLDLNDRKKFYLILRYHFKISKRLKEEQNRLLAKGKEIFLKSPIIGPNEGNK